MITRRDKRRFFHLKVEEAEDAGNKGDQRTLYRIVKDFGGAYHGCNESVIKHINGNNIVKRKLKAQRWRKHFQSVLNGLLQIELHVEDFIGEDL